MEHYAGLDVSLAQASVCIVDVQGGIVCEAKVASEPEALIGFLRARELPIARVEHVGRWHHLPLVRGGECDRIREEKESFEHGRALSLRHRGPVAGTVKLVKPQWQQWILETTLERRARRFL